MDNLTHSLFGLTLGRAVLGRTGRDTTAVLLLASNAPDIDIVATAGGAIKYLEWHRGPTHGPIGVVGLSLVVAALVSGSRLVWPARGSVNRASDPPPSFLMLWAVAIGGVICHVLMDLPTSYGTRLLSPFDWHWFAEDWMPIIDVYLLLALAAGLLVAGRSETARRRYAAVALGFMLINYGVRGLAHHQAMGQAARVFGPSLPPPCDDQGVNAIASGSGASRAGTSGWIDRWPQQPADAGTVANERARAARRCLIEVAAMPDFLSPFQWRLIARLSNAYETQTVNLLALPDASHAEWRLGVRYPNQWTPVVATAARSRLGTVFLGFSRFPSVSSVVKADGEATVVWRDMRFVTSDADRGPQRPNLFAATVRMAADGRVVEESFGP